MKKGWLEISDKKRLINWSRRFVYKSFGMAEEDFDIESVMDDIDNLTDSEQEELDSVVPVKDAENIIAEFIKKKRHKKTGKISCFIKEDDYSEFLVQLSNRMTSNIVSRLVAKGYLESAFDEEKNDFVFWIEGDKKDGNS